MTTTVRVGGVPEHFNLPWRLAIEEQLFDLLDVTVEWTDFPGGTGAIMRALAAGEIDMATPLTEGAITAIAKGNPSQLIRLWVDSPLLWGVYAAASSSAETIADLEGQRFAISRPGSGSELMSMVLAQDFGWTLPDDAFVVVGGLDGAIEALPAGDAGIFLWNKSMTQPHVDDGTFKRVGVFGTPWPSFAVAATNAMRSEHPGLAESIADIAAGRAGGFAIDDSAPILVAERYGLEFDGAAEWLAQVEFTPSGTPIDQDVLDSVADRMRSIGRID